MSDVGVSVYANRPNIKFFLKKIVDKKKKRIFATDFR